MKRIIFVALIAITLVCPGCGILIDGTGSGNQRPNFFCTYLNGYWGDWESFPDYLFKIRGNPDNFIGYSASSHPSQYQFKVTVNGFDKSVLKKLKEKDYSGSIETNGFSRSFVTVLPYAPPTDGRNMRTYSARIKVFYKGHDRYVYNIWFDNVGLGLDITFQ